MSAPPLSPPLTIIFLYNSKSPWLFRISPIRIKTSRQFPDFKKMFLSDFSLIMLMHTSSNQGLMFIFPFFSFCLSVCWCLPTSSPALRTLSYMFLPYSNWNSCHSAHFSVQHQMREHCNINIQKAITYRCSPSSLNSFLKKIINLTCSSLWQLKLAQYYINLLFSNFLGFFLIETCTQQQLLVKVIYNII